jgi:hypothetical protein
MKQILQNISKVFCFVAVFVLLLLIGNEGFGQTNGDYQTRNGGNWDAINTWSIYDNGWRNAIAADGYPGQNAGTGTVTILNNQSVTIRANVANNIGSLVVAAGANNTSVTFNGAYSLTVSGDINVNSTTNNFSKSIVLNTGTLNCSNLNLTSTGGNDNRDAFVVLTSGTLTVTGNITMNAVAARTYLRFNGGGTVNVGGTITGGGITSTAGGGAAAPTSGTVNYNGTNQTVGAYNYYHLTLSNNGTKTLQASTTNIGGNLTLSGTASTTTVVGLTIAGNLSIGDGTIFTAGGYDITVSGATTIGGGTNGTLNISAYSGTKIFTGLVTINSGGTWDNSSAASPITFRGGLTNNGTFTPGNTYRYTFDTNAQSLNGTINMGGASVIINGINLTNYGTFTLSSNFDGTGTLTNASSGTLNIEGSTYTNINSLNNQGTLNLTSTSGVGTATASFTNTGTLSLNGTAYITGITNNAGGTVNFINASQTIGTLNNATATSILNISALITTASAINILTATVAGNTVNYSGAGDQTIKNTTYSNLTVSGSGTKTLADATTINNALTLNGGTLSSGTTTGYALTGGTLNLANSSTIALGTGVHTLNFANSSGITWNGATLTITGWTGTAGSSGTAGRIVVGAGGLSAAQLAKINFEGYTAGAMIVSGEVVPSIPLISVTPSSLAFGFVTSGSTSTNQTYTLSGTGLTGYPGNITVTAPSNFQVSLSSGSGFASSINVSYATATLAGTTIYVRFQPTSPNTNYSGNVTNAGGGATTQNVAVSGNSNLSYCTFNFANVRPITGVVFNNLSNTSSALITSPAYEDYTNLTANVSTGQNYSLTVNGNTNGTNTYNYIAFFDWNQDGDFVDTGESFNIGTINNSTGLDGKQTSVSITVPSGATLGNTRMRIISHYNTYNTTPCASVDGNSYGQVEDYMVNVTPSVPSVSFTSASQSSAAESGTMTITAQLSASSSSTVTVPYNISGSASNGTDFTITPSPITIPAGSTTADITISIIDDAISDGNETVIVTMGTPTNATIGAVGTHIATITDDEPLLDSDGDGVGDQTDLDDDNDGIPDIREILCLPRPFTNGGFEENDPPGNPSYAFFNESVVDGWETTAGDGLIEIWDSGFNGVPSYSGAFHAEINGNSAARLFQTLAVNPGDQLEWEIAHRGRNGVDEMFVYVGPVGSPTLNATVYTGNTAWVVYRGSYLVPAGVYSVELGFQSGTTASGNPTIGNFIDFVSMFVVSSNSCDYDTDGIPDKLDLDSDNDGIYDVVEAGGPDTDNNGIIDGFGDSDGDGLANSVDDVGTGGGTALLQIDSDSDGSPDYFDKDADNDNCYDATEAGFTVNSGTGEIQGSGYNANGTVAGSDGYTTGGTGYNSSVNDRNSNSIYDFREAGSVVTLTVQPVDRSIATGATTTFTITGSAAVYQWQVSSDGGVNWTNITNGGVYSNATTATLTITGATYSMNGYLYRIQLTSPAYVCDTDITSNSARLTVTQAGLNISGLAFNDPDGSTSPNIVDGTAISNADGTPLYAVLVNTTTGLVIQSAIVSSGIYTFSGVTSGLNLSVLLGITNYTAGATPSTGLPALWIYTGEIQNNAGNTLPGNDGTLDGIYNIGNNITANQQYINFAIHQNNPPVAVDDATSTNTDTNVSLTVTTNDTDSDGTIDATSVDLDMGTSGIQNTYTSADGQWSVDALGEVTFNPDVDICGVVTTNYTVNDNAGISSNQATISITISDIQNPVISYRDANYDDLILVVSLTNDPVSITFDNFNDGQGPRNLNPTYSDNCSVEDFIYATAVGSATSLSSAATGIHPLNGSVSFNQGVTTLLWDASDPDNNNALQRDQIIMVLHQGDFTITCPDDQNLGCNPSSFPEGAASYTIPGNLATQIANGKVDTSVVRSSVLNAESCTDCSCSRTRTYTIEITFSKNGRIIEVVTLNCDQTYTYTVDTTNPTITCSADYSKCPDAGQTYYTVVGNEFDPTATNDNCGIASVLNNFDNTSSLAGSQLPAGVNTITWTITDICGNTASCETDVTVFNNFTGGDIATTGQTICYNGDPSVIGSTTPASGGDNSITYQWQYSTDAAWTSPQTIAGSNAATYNPPANLTENRWYRRQAHDGTCNTSFTTSTGAWAVDLYPRPTATPTLVGTYGICPETNHPPFNADNNGPPNPGTTYVDFNITRTGGVGAWEFDFVIYVIIEGNFHPEYVIDTIATLPAYIDSGSDWIVVCGDNDNINLRFEILNDPGHEITVALQFEEIRNETYDGSPCGIPSFTTVNVEQVIYAMPAVGPFD